MSQESQEYILECPHCQHYILIYHNELNCRIFRHGVYKHNNIQINPHLDKNSCDSLFENDQIYGCGKPFQIIGEGDTIQIVICGYI